MKTGEDVFKEFICEQYGLKASDAEELDEYSSCQIEIIQALPPIRDAYKQGHLAGLKESLKIADKNMYGKTIRAKIRARIEELSAAKPLKKEGE